MWQRLLLILVATGGDAQARTHEEGIRGHRPELSRPAMEGPTRRWTNLPDIVEVTQGTASCSGTVLGSGNRGEPPSVVILAAHCGPTVGAGTIRIPGAGRTFRVSCVGEAGYRSTNNSARDLMACSIEPSDRPAVAALVGGHRSCLAAGDFETGPGKQLIVCGYGFPHPQKQACMDHTLRGLRPDASGGGTYLFHLRDRQTRSGDSGSSFHAVGKDGVRLVHAVVSGAEQQPGRPWEDTAPSTTSPLAKRFYSDFLRRFPGTSYCVGDGNGAPDPSPSPKTPQPERTPTPGARWDPVHPG